MCVFVYKRGRERGERKGERKGALFLDGFFLPLSLSVLHRSVSLDNRHSSSSVNEI